MLKTVLLIIAMWYCDSVVRCQAECHYQYGHIHRYSSSYGFILRILMSRVCLTCPGLYHSGFCREFILYPVCSARLLLVSLIYLYMFLWYTVSCTHSALYHNSLYCQAQSQPQLSWTELPLILISPAPPRKSMET